MSKRLYAMLTILIVTAIILVAENPRRERLPVVAIANYGPHVSLHASIDGLKEYMTSEGFIEGKTVRYEIMDSGFNPALIPQMLVSLKAKKPKAMVVLTTPVAQAAKGKIPDIPLVYDAITDPVEAGLLKNKYLPDANMTGSSDMQDLDAFLHFAKSLLPKAKKIGLLYATAESNDIALVNMMQASARKFAMEVITIPIEQSEDVLLRTQEFRGKVDFIYVGPSGPIQPALPAIAAEARKMRIPVFNVETHAVRDGLALASFGVDYRAVGKNAGKLVAAILNGQPVSELPPLYPEINDHLAIINKKLAEEFDITVPANIELVG